LTEAEVLAAVRTGFGEPDADIELVDFSRTGVPNGAVVFERNALAAPATATPSPLLWRGFVRYGQQRRALIWAKVRIAMDTPEVVSATSITAGHIIGATDVRASKERRVWTGRRALPADAAIGRVAIRAIPAGIALRPEWLAPAPLIKPGDSVDVTVRNGATALQFMAKAATVGHHGQTVMLLNPMNGKTFKATVAGIRTARLDASRSVR
jgi:flagella basal body P-ring formation protein FlgA